MAGSKTDYLENKILDHELGTTTYTKPTVYVGLFTVAPTDSSAGTEVTGGSYARVVIPFGAASGGQASNSGTVSFTTASADWGTVIAWGLFDASSAGNLLIYGDVTSKAVLNGDTASFSSGAIVVQED